jgi:hypothetical protein
LKSPWNPPIGVRAAETMTMGSFMMIPFVLKTYCPQRSQRAQR